MKKLLFALLLLPLFCNAQFCAPTFTSGSRGEILNVSIGSLNNSTTVNCGTGYYDSSVAVPVLFRDSTYTLRVVFDSSNLPVDNSWYVLAIPFDTTPGYLSFFTSSRFYAQGGFGTGTTFPDTVLNAVTIPHSAILGYTRLRVVRYGHPSTTVLPTTCHGGHPTGNIGGSQDYTLKIEDAPLPSLQVQSFQARRYNVFPNPTTGTLHIDAPTGLPLRMLNTIGQMVVSEISKPEIDISSLPNGIYYLSINGANQMIQKR